MRLGRRAKTSFDAGSLPMTSMIDVVFLLLIFFMVTATFAEQEETLPSALSAEGRSAQEEPLEPQIVRVGPEPGDGDAGAMFVIGSNRVRTKRELTAVLSRLPKGPGVIVQVADDAPIWAAAAAMQAALDAGFEKRTYAPDPG
ncbi:MAG: biopolymer transporter ExbD [Planctomycetota bacterium]